MITARHTTKRTIVQWGLIVSLGMIVFAPNPAEAQHRYKDNNAAWWSAIAEQAWQSLDLPYAEARKQTMKNIHHFVTHYPDQADFRMCVTRLLDIYETEKDDKIRLLALNALESIRDEYSMRRLAQLADQEPPGRVREQTRAVLQAYHETL